MLGMGLTLELDEFRDAVSKPSQVALGVALQYTIMPVLGLVIGRIFPVARPVAVGLILVGCCPGGTASNLVTYLGRANVALSVVLTTASTFLAAFMTPFMTKTLAGTLVPVDAAGLMASTLQVVLLPILGGLTLKRLFPAAVAAVAPFCPLVAVFTVALICSSIIGQSAAAIASAGWTLLLAVACLHCAGFALGTASRGSSVSPSRTGAPSRSRWACKTRRSGLFSPPRTSRIRSSRCRAPSRPPCTRAWGPPSRARGDYRIRGNRADATARSGA